MSQTPTLRTPLVALALVLTGCAVPGTAPPEDTGPTGSYTDRWTLQEALRIPLDKTAQTTIPVIGDWPRGAETTLPDHHVWDSWPVRNLDNTLAQVRGEDGRGYYVMIHLSVDDDVLPGKRHDIAELRYSYSTDGRSWQPGGLVFPGGSVIGSRNWAGSAVMTADGRIHVFYTATGDKGETQAALQATPARANAADIDAATLRGGRLLPQSGSGFPGGGVSFEQRLVTASGPTARVVGGRVVFEGEWQHRVVVRADGSWYQTLAQADVGPLYGFRDPWVFRDARDGKLYMLFTANVGGTQSQQRCGPEDLGDAAFRASLGELPAEAPWYNGAVGLAVADGENLNSWTLLAPLLTASCVNQELERPHFVFRDGRYYLFFSSHIGKFAPVADLRARGAEGLYGFVGNSLRGDYQPLNSGGLVLNNPHSQPFQAYSYDVLQSGLVTSFIDAPGIGDQDISVVGNLPPEEQLRVFGGTLARTIRLDLQGDRSQIVGLLGYGQIVEGAAPAGR